MKGTCTARCDKGSRCTLPANHDGGHETEHGCVCYDPPEPRAGDWIRLSDGKRVKDP